MAVNTSSASGTNRGFDQTFEYSDEETDPSPEDLNKDNDDDESLIDINEVLSTTARALANQSTTPTSNTATGKREWIRDIPRHDLENCHLATSKPPEALSRAFLSPSVVGSKREAEDMISVVSIPEENTERLEAVASQRVRLDFESVSRESTIHAPDTEPQNPLHQPNGVSSAINPHPATSSTAYEQRYLTQEVPALVTVSLSNTNPFPQNAAYDINELGKSLPWCWTTLDAVDNQVS